MLNSAFKHISLIHFDANKKRIYKQNQRKLQTFKRNKILIILSTISVHEYEYASKMRHQENTPIEYWPP